LSIGIVKSNLDSDKYPQQEGLMSLRIGDIAPDFSAESTQGPLRFHDWVGESLAILFSHPRDFTPVCTTELGYVARLQPEFDRRGVKAIGLSIDPVDAHAKWSEDIRATQGPSAELPDRRRPRPEGGEPLRDDASRARNFDEILRVIDSLQVIDATAWPPPSTGAKAKTSSSSPPSPTKKPNRNSARLESSHSVPPPDKQPSR
jgi:alkyl hydroperoxide reductase subunit AhpC